MIKMVNVRRNLNCQSPIKKNLLFKLPCVKAIKLFGYFNRPIALYNSENLAYLTHHHIDALTQNKTSVWPIRLSRIGAKFI